MIKVFPSFYPQAGALRKHFETRFANPKKTSPERFVWDYWHVPNQYTLLRTPAYHFFPRRIYENFHRHLVLWGRKHLGCHDVSPPWLSVYIHGCRQELHGDFPHGPWAYVYSLTQWRQRHFLGGETLLLKENILDHWGEFDSHQSFESEQIFTKIEPHFNQLTLFDPRIPHGVAPVEGVFDPSRARIVVHGWFVNPRPFIEGSLSTRELESNMGLLSQELESELRGCRVHGTLALRFAVLASGKVAKPQVLFSNLRAIQKSTLKRSLEKNLLNKVAAWTFKKQRGRSFVTLPIQFE